MNCSLCAADLSERSVWFHLGEPYCLPCTVDQVRNDPRAIAIVEHGNGASTVCRARDYFDITRKGDLE